MASTKEGRVKNSIRKLLKQHRAYFTMPVMTGFATNGTPDFAICLHGRYLAIEAKAGDGLPTELQWVRLTEVQRAGGSTMVINETNMNVLEAWLKGDVQTVRAVRNMEGRGVMHHWTEKGAMK